MRQLQKCFGLLTTYAGKIGEEHVQRVTCFEMCHERVYRNTRSGEYRRSTEDVFVLSNDLIISHVIQLPKFDDSAGCQTAGGEATP